MSVTRVLHVKGLRWFGFTLTLPSDVQSLQCSFSLHRADWNQSLVWNHIKRFLVPDANKRLKQVRTGSLSSWNLMWTQQQACVRLQVVCVRAEPVMLVVLMLWLFVDSTTSSATRATASTSSWSEQTTSPRTTSRGSKCCRYRLTLAAAPPPGAVPPPSPALSPQTMHAHAQFCMSGDHTLEGTRASILQLSPEEADERFVVVLSDANLERYGIPPERFARVLTSDPQVNAFAVFIGSLGDQAER